MKKILILLIFLFLNNSLFASNNIVYLDVQFIIDNSDLGKFYKNKLKMLKTKKII